MKEPMLVLAVATMVLGGCQTDSDYQSNIGAADLSDFVGARAGQAEMGLQSRGYQPARTEGLTGYWWNAGSGSCARIVTADGRYQSIDSVSPSQCGRSASTAVATPSAVGAPPPDLTDMVGARAGQAEMGMQSRGYAAARTQGLTTFWWNQSTGTCAQIVTGNGRYQSIAAVPAGQCNA